MRSLFDAVQEIVSEAASFTLVLDETNYNGFIDIQLPTFSNVREASIQGIRDALRQYGLDPVEEYKKMHVVVIKAALHD